MSKLDSHQILQDVHDSTTHSIKTSNVSGTLVSEEFDYYTITYVPLGQNGENQPQTVTYKLGGAGGTTVATLTYTYNALHQVTSVSKS